MHAFVNAFVTELLPYYTGCISNAGIKFKRAFFTSHEKKWYKRVSGDEWFSSLIERLHSKINTLTV